MGRWRLLGPSSILPRDSDRIINAVIVGLEEVRTVSANIMEATDANWKDEVLESSEPVLVDFWAVWCAPCRMVAPVVEAIAEEYSGKLKVVKLNVDENQQTAVKYQVMSIPTLAFFDDGQLVKTVVGFRPKEELAKEVDQVISQ